MDYFPGNWGNARSRDNTLYSSHDYFPGSTSYPSSYSNTDVTPIQRTQEPIVTGSSVLGLRYKDGVMIAADTGASYGRLSRFRDVERLLKVSDTAVLGASGDISDFQHIKYTMETLNTVEYDMDDGHKLTAQNVFEYMSIVMYGRRSKFNPLWNSLVIGGYKNDKAFLGYVDLLGTTYESPAIATGYGSYIAIPLLRKAVENGGEENLTEEQARKVMEDCLRVLYYRDSASLNKIQIATINASGVKISEPYSLETEWAFGAHVRGYGA